MYILNSKSRWPLSGTSRIAERFYFNLSKTFQLNWPPPSASIQHVKQRCQPRFELIDDAKFGIKSIHSQFCVILPEMRQKLRLLPLFCVISASISSP